jgi:hypothetical protein
MWGAPRQRAIPRVTEAGPYRSCMATHDDLYRLSEAIDKQREVLAEWEATRSLNRDEHLRCRDEYRKLSDTITELSERVFTGQVP